MDINFPLIMVLLVLAGIIIWLLDSLFWASKRKARVAALNKQYPKHTDEKSEDGRNYRAAFDATCKEPSAVEYSKSLTPVLLLVLVLRSFIIEPFQIPSGSMIPTLEVGDFILVNKFSYGLRLPVLRSKVVENGDPQRGDVMVFFPPNDSRYFIKRVIGLPGDVIEYRGKALFINGEQQNQTLIEEQDDAQPRYADLDEDLNGVKHVARVHLTSSPDFTRDPGCIAAQKPNFTVTVEAGHYFMMGDNRDNSSDSRCWGQVPEENIVGKAFAIWMHKDPGMSLPTFSRVGSID